MTSNLMSRLSQAFARLTGLDQWPLFRHAVEDAAKDVIVPDNKASESLLRK